MDADSDVFPARPAGPPTAHRGAIPATRTRHSSATPQRRRMAQVACAVAVVTMTAIAHGTEPSAHIPAPYRSVASGLPVVPFGVGTGARGADHDAMLLPPLHWDVRPQDLTLAHTLERWGGLAGYRVEWNAARSVPIAASASFEGTFEAVLQTVLASPEAAGVTGVSGVAAATGASQAAGAPTSSHEMDALEACIYAASPPLVRITRRGEQGVDCASR